MVDNGLRPVVMVRNMAANAYQDVSGELTRSGKYRLAAEADVHVRVVEMDWASWKAGEAPSGSVRARLRRVAIALGVQPPSVPCE